MNVLDYAKIFMKALDKLMVQGSTTGWMEANAMQVKYNGGNEFKIPKLMVSGLKDYDRAGGGYGDAGGITQTYQTFGFDKDRATKFGLDSQDVDETNFVIDASIVMEEFLRTQVIPEVDSYRYSKIYQTANAVGKVGDYEPAEATIFQQLKSDISKVQDIIGESTELVVAMSYSFGDILDNADKVVKNLVMSDFKLGEVTTKTMSLNGIPLMRIPSARLRTAYDYKTGSESGFTAVDGAGEINYIIMPKSAVVAITKASRPKIITPELNQLSDEWIIAYRIYHTLIIPENKMAGVLVSRKPMDAVSTTPLTLVTANNTVTVTLADGAFKAGITIEDLEFTGTDATALAGATLVRTSDTVLTLTIATGNVGTDNVITVTGDALELQATAVTAVASTV